MSVPMGPGFFLFFKNHTGGSYYGTPSAPSFNETVGVSAFKEYRKILKEENLETFDEVVLEDIPKKSYDKQLVIDALMQKVIDRQMDQWQEAIDYIEQYEIQRQDTESRRQAMDLFRQRTQLELERRIEDEQIAIIIAIIEAMNG